MFTMDIEFQSATEIKQFQEALLQQQLLYLQANSPYYQRVFADKGIDVKTIQQQAGVHLHFAGRVCRDFCRTPHGCIPPFSFG